MDGAFIMVSRIKKLMMTTLWPTSSATMTVAAICLLLLSPLSCTESALADPLPQDAPALPVIVSPTASQIKYTGRFAQASTGESCSWPASEVAIRFYSRAVNVRLNESDNNDEYQVFLDGVPTAVLVPSSGDHLYRLYTSTASQTHSLALVKRTETLFGVGTFEGFQLATGGKLLRPNTHLHKIEVIGDSISCGYGDEAARQTEHFSSATEDAAFAYGAVASRALDADYVCIAWSGKKMWPDNTLPELYDRTLAADTNSKWDFTRWVPGAVVINLSTNDFNGAVLDQAGWTAGYEAFIKHVRSNYPKAMIYCTTSPMMSGPNADTLLKYLNQIVADEKASGDDRVAIMPFKTQDGSLGFGADWHPNIENQAKTASTMVATISRDMNWKVGTDLAAGATNASLNALPKISLTSNNGN
jgi:hypothetical protein